MIEVLKQALKAFEVATTPLAEDRQEILEAVAAINQAIAELESQEPFGYVNRDELVEHMGLVSCGTIYKYPAEGRLALYTHPPQPAKPIPCANHCEATAFEIVIKNLQGEIARLKAPQREWVGLTDEDIKSVRQTFPSGSIEDLHIFARALLDKAKEKNS